MNTVEKGKLGESIACNFLKSRGMTILCQNYRAGKSEIDIIARDGDTTVFIEVKARTNKKFGTGGQAITPHKISMLILGAQSYCAQNGLFDSPIRFDVIEINLSAEVVESYLENAFFT